MTGCHKSTIYREIKRNRLRRGHYEGIAAQKRARIRRRKAGELPRKLKAKSGDEVARAMISMMANDEMKTITSDRGSEFARYRRVEGKVGADWYVCDARRPDQRGGIEGIIRQVRHYYPRKTAASDITPSGLAAVIRRLNAIPRKSLNYKTPAEVMKEIG